MDIDFFIIFYSFIFSPVFMFTVLLATFILGGFLITIFEYFMVKKIQNKIKSHRRALNIFAGIFVFISIATVFISLNSVNFAMAGTWIGGFIAMPFAYVIIYNVSFIVFAKRKDIRLKLEELEMLKRSSRF